MFEKLPPKILIVESDEVIRNTICNTIERYWFSVIRASDSKSALLELNKGNINVLIVSSKISSSEVIELVGLARNSNHNTPEIPVILLLEATEDENVYHGIKNTLTDLIRRPFTPNELMLSIKALLRVSNPVFQDKIIKYKDLSMNLATFKVHRANKEVHLGPTEFKILQMLVQSPRNIFTREQIISNVWGNKEIEARTVDVHVNRIRSLIRLSKNEPPLIKTIRAAGYCLNLPGERE